MALSIEKDVGFESRQRVGDFLRAWLHPCPHHLMTRRQQMLKKNEQDEQASACFEIDYCIIMA
jgi:hypothetical protein